MHCRALKGRSGQRVNGLCYIGKNVLGVSWGKKIKLKTVIPLQGNPYPVVCFVAKLVLCATMPEV